MNGLRKRFRKWRVNRAVPDPRARQVIASAWLLYEQIDPGDEVMDVAITVYSHRQIVTYSLSAGNAGIKREVAALSDMDRVAEAVTAMSSIVIDATAPDTP